MSIEIFISIAVFLALAATISVAILTSYRLGKDHKDER